MRMPEISDKSVLLPQPLCPMMATNSPGAIKIETSLSASVSPSRPKYRRLTLRSSTFGAAAPDGAATDHFALLKNSVTTRSANFTRLFGSSTWKAQDLLALERLPVEFVDLLAPDQHEAVRRGQPAEDRNLDGRVAVLDVDRRFRADERDVGLVGQHDRNRLVAALCGRERDVEPELIEVALGDCHIGRRVEHRAHDLVVANFDARFRLRKGSQRSSGG